VRRSCSTIVFIHLSYQRGRERKHKKQDRGGEKKREKAQEKRKTINQQGLPFGLCFHFLHIKSAEQRRRKCRKPVERKRHEDCRGETQKKNANRE
jgi:hypothetical protein